MAQTLVLGAGMVGIGTALALQERGQEVVLIDRRGPGEETSYGNAGIIQTEAAEPVAMPRSLGALFAIATGRTNDVVWHLRALPEHLRPLASYFRNSAPARHRRIAQTYARLTRRATEDHAPLIEAAGAEALIRKEGFLVGFRSPHAFDRERRSAESIGRDYGVPFAALTGDELGRKQPGLRRAMAGAIHWTGPWTCRDPGGLVAAYATLFAARGGRILRGDAMTLAPRGAGWSCTTGEGPVEAANAVIALGPWSTALTKRFGYRVPLFRKRGYHRHFAPVSGPAISMLDAENGAFLAVMDKGIRVTTGAEITGFTAPPVPRQLERGLAGARELFDLGEPVEPAPWLGHRPCLPDMLPLVCPAPGRKGLWFNFGHGHQGFTLGPTTGVLLAELMTGDGGSEIAENLAYRWG